MKSVSNFKNVKVLTKDQCIAIKGGGVIELEPDPPLDPEGSGASI